jgi:hypothetical protein
VENSGLSRPAVLKSLVLPESAYGEGRFVSDFFDAFRFERRGDSVTDRSREAKVSDFHAFPGHRQAFAARVNVK